jgi:hypothetical protein
MRMMVLIKAQYVPKVVLMTLTIITGNVDVPGESIIRKGGDDIKE